MARYWCLHCYKVVVMKEPKGESVWTAECPFCGAGYFSDLWSIKKTNLPISEDAKHGDYVGYPERKK